MMNLLGRIRRKIILAPAEARAPEPVAAPVVEPPAPKSVAELSAAPEVPPVSAEATEAPFVVAAAAEAPFVPVGEAQATSVAAEAPEPAPVADPAPAIAAANEARQRGDWAEAARLCAALREAFPDVLEGYLWDAGALRELADLDEAELVLRAAAERFPAVSGVWHDLGRVAEQRRDWATAEYAWRTFLEIDASQWWAHTSLANALREQGRVTEAEAVLVAAQAALPGEPMVFVDYARIAEGARDWDTALTRWADLRERFPDRWDGYGGGARALRELGRVEEQEALLTSAVARFPGNGAPLHDLARLAEQRRDWPAAERAWRQFISNGQSPWWAHTSLAVSIWEQGKHEETLVLMEEIKARFPAESAVFVQSARFAEMRNDWEEALRCWDIVRRRFPTEWIGFGGGMHAFRQAGRAEEGEQLLLVAAARFPDLASPRHDLARLAENRRDWLEAERRWREFLAIDPGPWWAHAGLSNALREQGRREEADAMLAELETRYPHEAGVLGERARLAALAGEWAEAAEIWQKVRGRFAAEISGYVQGSHALEQLGQDEAADALLMEAAQRFPHNLDVARSFASFPARRQDWPISAERWSSVHKEFPNQPSVSAEFAWALHMAGQDNDALRIIAGASERFPPDPQVARTRLALAVSRADWPLVIQCAERLLNAWPDEIQGYLDGARARIELGRPEDAFILIESGLARIPNSPALIERLVQLCGTYPDLPATSGKLASLAATTVDDARLSVAVARGLRYAGKADEAEPLLVRIRARAGSNREVMVEAALVALASGAYEVAAKRFAEIIETFGYEASLQTQLAEATFLAGNTGSACDLMLKVASNFPRELPFWDRFFDIASKAGRDEDAVRYWRAIIERGYLPAKDTYEIAHRILMNAPSDSLASEAFALLLSEPDPGGRDWLPAIHRLEWMTRFRDAERLFTLARACIVEAGDVDFSAPRAMLKSILGIPRTAAEIDTTFSTLLRFGRMPVASRILKASNREQLRERFDIYLTKRLQDWRLETEEDFAEVYAYLILCATCPTPLYTDLMRLVRTSCPETGEDLELDLSTARGVVINAARLASSDAVGDPAIAARTRRLNIALCISGELRGYKEAKETWSALGLEAHSVDVFVHTWKSTGFQWARMWTALLNEHPALRDVIAAPSGETFLRSRYPHVADVMDAIIARDASVDETTLATFYGASKVVVEERPDPDLAARANVWKLHTKVERCHELARESGKDYDLIIRIRPDLAFNPIETPDWWQVYQYCLDNNVILTDGQHDFSHETVRVGDQFAVGTAKAMDTYAGLASTLLGRQREGRSVFGAPRGLETHTSLALHLIQNGIFAREFQAARPARLVNISLSAEELLPALKRDIESRESIAFDQDFLLACQGSPTRCHELARQAEAGKDWLQAERHWRDYIALDPRQWWAYTALARTLRHLDRGDEAEATLTLAQAKFPQAIAVFVDYAQLAEARRDLAEALNRWEAVRTNFPGEWLGFGAVARVLQDLGRFEEAEATLLDAMERFPTEDGPVHDLARLADRQRDLPKAERWWRVFLKRAPGTWWSYTALARVLEEAGQVGEAKELLLSAVERFPTEGGPSHSLAQMAERERDWSESERWCRASMSAAPDVSLVHLGLVRSLWMQGRHQEADAAVLTARERFPDDKAIAIEAARTSERLEDFAEAALRWRVVTARWPMAPEGPSGEAYALCRAGRSEEADAIVRAALDRMPDQSVLYDVYGRNAMARGAWAEARDRLEQGQLRFPDNNIFRQRLFEVGLRSTDAGLTDNVVTVVEPVMSEADANRALVMQFESLGGGGHGCEFGLFQRFYGAEPLGLLRWSDIFQNTLVQMLDTEFEGVGEPEFTHIIVPEGAERPSYWMTDKRYHMMMNSFVYVDEVPLDRMFRQMTTRMRFLRRKLIDDLRSGSKIFVYKNMKRNLTDHELEQLHNACRRYGDNTLFYIRYQDAEHPFGTVVLEKPGLIVGYIDRFSHAPDTDELLGPSADRLLTLCRSAYAIWQAGRQPVEPVDRP